MIMSPDDAVAVDVDDQIQEQDDDLELKTPSRCNQDTHLWCIGIICCYLFMALIVLTAQLHWHRGVCIANNGQGFVAANTYYSPCHAPYLQSGKFGKDRGAFWYFWRLIDKQWSSSLITGTLYLAHLFANFFIVYRVQCTKTHIQTLKLQQQLGHDHRQLKTLQVGDTQTQSSSPWVDVDDEKQPYFEPKYSSTLHWYNWALFAVNLLAYFVHLLCTHTIYDGLASNVSIWSSQASVIYVILMLFILHIPSRGLLFGLTCNTTLNRKCCSEILHVQTLLIAVRKYHCYPFLWAIVYTFWYHPMEPLLGHLTGFSFIFLLFLQCALMYTRMHKHVAWTVCVEMYFVFHSSTTAIQNTSSWLQFTNGPLLVYSITVLPSLIDYVYQRGQSALYCRLIPIVLVLPVTLVLRCYVANQCDMHLLKDYQFAVSYYVLIPCMLLLMSGLLKLFTHCCCCCSCSKPNVRVICNLGIAVLFGVLQWFCVYSEQQKMNGLLVTLIIVFMLMFIHLLIYMSFS